MSENTTPYTGPERRKLPRLEDVPSDVEGLRAVLMEHLSREEHMQTYMESQFEDLRTLITAQGEKLKTNDVSELVDILKGIKFLRGTVVILASIAGGAFALIDYLKDHGFKL